MGLGMLLGMGFNTGFDNHFAVFGIMFTLVLALVLTVFVVVAVKGISRWNKNNNSPRLTVYAEVVSRREHITHHHYHNTGTRMHGGYSTRYFVTFQVESGDRMELEVYGEEYGLLIEGDKGNLTIQGTRYLGFQRM